MFKDIVSGEPLPVENTARYNAVNRLLKSRELGVETAPAAAFESVIVAGLNQTDKVIPAGFPVELQTGGLESWERDIWNISGYTVVPASDGSGFWGIAAENINPGSYGHVVIHGVTAAEVTEGGSGDYVSPAAGELIRTAAAGRGRVLKISGNLASIYLADAVPAGDPYNGPCKLILTGDRHLLVVDGGTYEQATGTSGNSICRVNNRSFALPATDLGVVSYLPRTVYLKFDAEQNIVTAELGGSAVPDDTEFFSYYQIGRVIRQNDGYKIVQDHCSGVPQMWWSFVCQ